MQIDGGNRSESGLMVLNQGVFNPPPDAEPVSNGGDASNGEVPTVLSKLQKWVRIILLHHLVITSITIQTIKILFPRFAQFSIAAHITSPYFSSTG